MKTISIDNGNSKTTVNALNEEQIKVVVDNIGLMERDENYLKAEKAAECAENDREWVKRFVEAYEGEIVIG